MADVGRVAEPPKTDLTPSSMVGSTALGMLGVSVLALLLCGFAVRSKARWPNDSAVDDPAGVRARRMTYAAAVGAAFCFGLAVASAVVLLTESHVVEPPPALAIVEAQRVDQWRHEASTLKERLSVLDARLASLEATRAADGEARQQSTRTALIDRVERDRARTAPGPARRPGSALDDQERHAISAPYVLADSTASAKLTTADVLRPPRVPEGQSVGDRVWNDIVRDWERLRRTVLDWLPRDAP